MRKQLESVKDTNHAKDVERMVFQNFQETMKVKEVISGLTSGLEGVVYKEELDNYATREELTKTLSQIREQLLTSQDRAKKSLKRDSTTKSRYSKRVSSIIKLKLNRRSMMHRSSVVEECLKTANR